jgi:hypothetical protein
MELLSEDVKTIIRILLDSQGGRNKESEKKKAEASKRQPAKKEEEM